MSSTLKKLGVVVCEVIYHCSSFCVFFKLFKLCSKYNNVSLWYTSYYYDKYIINKQINKHFTLAIIKIYIMLLHLFCNLASLKKGRKT